MNLTKLALQNFRSYELFSTDISSEVTIFIGHNTAGKTNLIEAISLLSTGKSFRVEKDMQMIKFNQEIARIKGLIVSTDNEKVTLEAIIAQGVPTNGRLLKKFIMNNIPKRRVDFAGVLTTILFSPEELDIVSGGPSIRRNFLDHVLMQASADYRHASNNYEKALRQRNALLSVVKDTGRRNKEQFEYWDRVLIASGQLITQKREEFIAYINQQEKNIFKCSVEYDKSIISDERLLQYKDVEVKAGVTLVGPHRDDFVMHLQTSISEPRPVKYFGSRGQQRLAVLQLKLIQLHYLEKITNQKPLLLLDDIFSELDSNHMNLVLHIIQNYQTVMTTTHEEFISSEILEKANVIKLKTASR